MRSETVLKLGRRANGRVRASRRSTARTATAVRIAARFPPQSADAIIPESLFQSFFMGGFECSTHRLHSGRRLDLIAATEHDRFALADYERLRSLGLRAAREGLRWHLVEAIS